MLLVVTGVSADEPSRSPASDFDRRAAVLHFGPRADKRDTVILVQLPAIQTGLPDGQPGSPRRALVVRVEDGSGDTVERFTREWSTGEMERKTNGTLVFRKSVALAPGDYTLESSVLDLISGRRNVERQPFSVPRAEGLALSSLALVSRSASEEGASPDDPFRVGPSAFRPRLDPRLPAGATEVTFLARVYAADDAPLALTFEARRDGVLCAEMHRKLTASPGPVGTAWVGSLPLSSLPPGRYEALVRLEQGARRAEETVDFELSPPAPEIADPELADLLDKAGRYVEGYMRTYQDLVAEEVYDQYQGTTRRRTVADIVVEPLGGFFHWSVFRDVFKVDGHAVRDRLPRLERLFGKKDASAMERALAIQSESARYNIGIFRTVNEPTLPLAFLRPDNLYRFHFRRKGQHKVSGVRGTEVVFEEVVRPTIVRDTDGGDNPAHGRFWIDPEHGTVLRSELTFEMAVGFGAQGSFLAMLRRPSASQNSPPADVLAGASPAAAASRARAQAHARAIAEFERDAPAASLEVEYRPEPALSIWVPSRMQEEYPGLRATARYSGYRRLSVETEEAVHLPQPK